MTQTTPDPFLYAVIGFLLGWTVGVSTVILMAHDMVPSMKTETALSHAEWMDILENTGIYPQSISGGDAGYEKRTDYMEGWNAAVTHLTNEVVVKLKGKQNAGI